MRFKKEWVQHPILGGDLKVLKVSGEYRAGGDAIVDVSDEKMDRLSIKDIEKQLERNIIAGIRKDLFDSGSSTQFELDFERIVIIVQALSMLRGQTIIAHSYENSALKSREINLIDEMLDMFHRKANEAEMKGVEDAKVL